MEWLSPTTVTFLFARDELWYGSIWCQLDGPNHPLTSYGPFLVDRITFLRRLTFGLILLEWKIGMRNKRKNILFITFAEFGLYEYF